MSKNPRHRKFIQISALLIAALGVLVIIFVFIDGLSPQKEMYIEEPISKDSVTFTPNIAIETPTKPTAQSTPSTIEKPPPMPLAAESSDDISKTVYITEGGKKYHRHGCQYLSNSSIPIDLDKAKDKGYTPCSRCHPPS